MQLSHSEIIEEQEIISLLPWKSFVDWTCRVKSGSKRMNPSPQTLPQRRRSRTSCGSRFQRATALAMRCEMPLEKPTLKGIRHRIGPMTIENIKQHVDIDPITGCWNWKLYRLNGGYGLKTQRGRRMYAHRLSFAITKGPIPDGCEILHSCDNPSCINPKHLTSGTRRENVDDCIIKGRIARGEQLPQTVLRECDVAEIRNRHRAGETMESIRQYFKISRGCVRGVIRRINWKHLP